jgi:hypothetical protein
MSRRLWGVASLSAFAWAVLVLSGAPALAAEVEDGGDAGPLDFEAIYDPYQGMDKNGRIPSIEKPADLPNPDRWRYIPEGRIKPGSIFQRFLVTSFMVPFVFRNSDTGIGGGLALTDIDFRNQRRREFAGAFFSYTSKGQQSYWGLWRRWLHQREVPEGGVLQEERSFVGVSGGYQKTLTRRFFGFGPDSDEDDEVKYTDKLVELEVELAMAIPEPGANLVGTIGLRGEYHSLSTNDFDCDETSRPNDQELPRVCPGDWDQTSKFRSFIDNDDHERLGFLVAGLRWDTRDSQRNPYKGYELGVSVDAPLVQKGGDVGARFTLDASTAFAVPGIFHRGGDEEEENPPTDTIAVGGKLWMKAGDLPFTALPNLGGSVTLRGYRAGRWRDDAAWHAGLEHRIWVIPRGFEVTPTIRVERIGVAPFVEAGTVGSDGIDVFQNDVKFSYGIGLRVLLERAAPFRLDFGFSDEGFNWAARFGYTF